MKKIVKTIGCVNAAMPMALYTKRERLIGWCVDTPNSFACACQMDERVFKGVAVYPHFEDTVRMRSDSENQDRMKMNHLRLKDCVQLNK